MTLTPHHLFYLLSKFDELGISVGAMNVRLENLQANTLSTNYVSFLNSAHRRHALGSDRDSIHSMSSVHSVLSGISNLWSNLGLQLSSSTKAEKQKLQMNDDLTYLYSAFTKIPCLQLAANHKAPLISGYEEYPFDAAVPLFIFKNVSTLEISDIDFRSFYGWDRMADQLRSLTVKRAAIENPTDLLVNIVLDDQDGRRRRISKAAGSPTQPIATPGTTPRFFSLARSNSVQSTSSSPGKFAVALATATSSVEPSGDHLTKSNYEASAVRGSQLLVDAQAESSSSSETTKNHRRHRSASPARVLDMRHEILHDYGKHSVPRQRRSSGSSNASSGRGPRPQRRSSSSLLSFAVLPSSRWQFLRFLSLSDNALTNLPSAGLVPLANGLHSLDLSYNLFTEIPDSLATLTSLRALNLSNCMIESLHSLVKKPLPAITVLSLRANRLTSLAGIERLPSLERLDLRENNLKDPTEMARLTSAPEFREVFIKKNPLVKTHNDYRTVIFNIFRKAGGYSDDLSIDCQGPTVGEKRHLITREPGHAPRIDFDMLHPELGSGMAAESLGKVVETALEQISACADATNATKEADPTVSAERYTDTSMVQSPATDMSQRRKKGLKRRVVDLSHTPISDSTTREPLRSEEADEHALRIVLPTKSVIGQMAEVKQLPARSKSPDSKAPQDSKAAADTSQERPVNLRLSGRMKTDPLDSMTTTDLSAAYAQTSDKYKQKIETLRQDFGDSWLTALGDESWENRIEAGMGVGSVFGSARLHPARPALLIESPTLARTMT